MFFRYLKIALLLIPLIVFINLLSNYIKIIDKELSVIQNISLLFDASSETKSEVLSILDFKYKLKNKTNSEIKKIYLEIELSSLEKSKLNIESNSENKKYFNAKIKFDQQDSPLRINFRMRGKNHWHHRLDKPSLRLKLKKEKPYKMMRHINLISPEGRTIIENYYPDIIAKKIGLTAHHGELIELIINNKSYGIYHLTSREDESMIRLNKRMPGPLLLGQYLKEKWKLNDFEIVNGESIENSKDFFEQMIRVINSKKENIDWNTIKNLWMIMNFEQTAKFVSLNNILGIIHNDYFHNQEFYFDPTKGRVEPIISDAMSLGTMLYPWGKRRFSLKTFFSTEKPNYQTSINQKTNPLLNIALLDPEFNWVRVNILYKLIKDDLSFEKQKKQIDKIYRLIDKTVYNDKKKHYLTLRIGGWNNQKYSNFEYEIFKKNVFFYIKNRNKFIEKEITQNDLILKNIKIEEYPNKKFIKIKYKGYGGLVLAKKDFEPFNVIVPKNGKLISINSNKLELYTGLKIEKNSNYQTNIVRGNDMFHSHQYTTDYQTYIIEIDKKNFSRKDIEKLFISSLTSEGIKNINWENDESFEISEINYNNNSLHIWNKENLNYKKIITIGPGLVELNRNLKIKKKQVLNILPGTTILMHPGVSIYSKGKMFIDGTKDKIIIKRKNKDKPWGIISINGQGSNGSVLKNLSVSGGSSAIIENINYSGMLSFFWNKNILIENLVVSNNQEGDDTIHFSNSNGIINNLNVSKCFGDCIDFDYSQYNLKNINIDNSGNDGIDFMESKIEGNNIKVTKAMDKGLSAGENSRINIDDISISSSLIGIAVKDLSNVYLKNVDFNKNSTAVDIYRKNWRYKKEGELNLNNFKFNYNNLDIATENLDSLKFDTKNLNIIKR